MRQIKRSYALAVAVTLVAVSAALAGSLEPPGPPGSTMKTLVEIEPRVAVQSLDGSFTAMHVITEPGSYYLTGDITADVGMNGIEILADNVVLDLNGFALLGSPGSMTSGLSGVLLPGPQLSVVIKNGTIHGWAEHGIAAPDCSGCQARDIVASECGTGGSYTTIFFGEQALIANCTVHNSNGWNGFEVQSGSRIEGCVSIGNVNGYELSGEGNAIVGSVAQWPQNNGIYIQSTGIVEGCVAEYGYAGIRTGSSARIVGNNVSNNQYGVLVEGNDVMVRGNAATGNAQAGIHVGSGLTGTTIVDNTVIDNGTGIVVEGFRNLAASNTAARNAVPWFIGPGNAYGELLDFSSGGTITSNNAWANVQY